MALSQTADLTYTSLCKCTFTKLSEKGVMMNSIIPIDNDDGSISVITRQRLDTNPAATYIASLTSPRSQRVQWHAVNTIAGMLSSGQHNAVSFPWHELRYQHVAALRSKLAKLTEKGPKNEPAKYSASTVNRMLCALRRTLKESWRLGDMSAEDYHRSADVQNVKSDTLPSGRGLGSGEIDALMTVCAKDKSAAGIRDGAMIATLYGTGIRRAEIVGLELADYTAESGQLIVRGKGRKERTSYLPEGAAAALADWLRIRGDHPGPLFCPISRTGVLQCQEASLTAQAIYNMLKKRAGEAGVNNFSPHDLRRTFVSDMLDRGADIATVQKLAGHASPTTTARYDRRPEEAKRKAANLLHVPYTSRG
jgi:site-specific recombinase XerD